MTASRRRVLASAIAAPFVARAQAPEPLTFATPFGFIPDFIEMMNMVSGGHLAAQGFAPRLVGAQGTSAALQQLLAGQAAFARTTAIDQFLAVAKSGAPLVAIATLYQAGTFQVISLADKPIREAKDFAGKTVGIVSVGGSTDLLLDIMLRKAGVPKDAVKREVVGNSPGAVQFIRQGRIDCFIAAIGVAVTLRRGNTPVEVWSTDRHAPMPGQAFVTTAALAESRPETVVRFLRALRASATEIMQGDKRAIFQRAARDFEIPGIRDLDALVALTEVAVTEMWLSQGRANFLRNVPALWEAADEGIRGAGIAAVPDPLALYTNRFIDRALAG
jgi:ABC-type nitrate/sulfonate/bicarbonate transport system substrate-binding protein